ncbi:MAG: phosphate signaling complex protein PhoU [Clostridia bacterium]|nr:phosphate signaling complex protein PhoU [Clostridia bacterium]
MQRPQLHQELENIHNELLKMGSLVEEAILMAIQSLKNKDIELAYKVIEFDSEIDKMEDIIEDKCIKFIARQHPLAGDLREIMVITKMITDLERIGDHCEDIAKYTIKLKHQKYIKELIDIPKIADMASKMVTKALDAFVKKDPDMARTVWKKDDEIDLLYKAIYNELLEIMAQDKSKIFQCTTFLFITAHLERIGDYATNICEKTVYSTEGAYQMD